ncbi:MAG: hypothetical protein MUE96_08040 [Bacteroidia bacterium]|jgi:hypothetical protein|nr:hypothetical protein [Bacteroidia bacterium]
MLNNLFNIKIGDTSVANTAKVEALLTQKLFVVKDSNLSSRVFNHWVDKNLMYSSVNTENTDTRKWFRLSLTEVIWVNMLQTMRKYGMRLSEIKQVRDALCNPMPYKEYHEYTGIDSKQAVKDVISQLPINNPKDKIDTINWINSLENEQLYTPQTRFELILVSILLENAQIEIRICQDQSMMIVTDQDKFVPIINSTTSKLYNQPKKEQMTALIRQPSLVIPINFYLQNLFTDINGTVFMGLNEFMEENQKSVFSYLREQKVKSVTIEYGTNESETIDIIERKNKQLTQYEYQKLMEKLIKQPYQNVTVKTRDGKSKVFVIHESTTRINTT